MRTVTKAFLRYLPRRRSLSILQLLGIACGVAAAVGMAISAQVALSSFTQAVEFLKGRATHSLERPAGPLEDAVLSRLMKDPAVEFFSPVIDRRVNLVNGETVRLLGIDPFLDKSIRPELARSPKPGEGGSKEPLSFLFDEHAVLVDSHLAQKMGLHAGDDLQTNHGTLPVAGVFSHPSSEPVILMDIAHAQRFFLLSGKIDRVDLILGDESGFRDRWSQGFRIQSGQQRKASLGDMLRAFRLNLQALSLLALFVGVFLVYNTAMFAVVSRRRDAGILRSLGATRREILAAFSAEILLLGALGGALGGTGGFYLSRFLTSLMAETISNLYFFLSPAAPAWSFWIPLIGIFLGCGASALGGFPPLVELLRSDPVRALQGRVPARDTKRSTRRAAWAGVFVLMAAAILAALSFIHVYFGFASSFGLLIGASLFTGLLLIGLAPAIKWLLEKITGLPGKVAAGNIRQNLGRTAVAVAAFTDKTSEEPVNCPSA